MSGCRHEWHDHYRLSFPCPDCGAWDDDMTDYKQPSVLRDVPSTASAHTDYHELPEVPLKCCAGCDEWYLTVRYDIHDMPEAVSMCGIRDCPVAPHGLCSHWERRDGSC